MLKKLINLYNSRKASERIMMVCMVYLAVFVCYSKVKSSSEEFDKPILEKQTERDELLRVLNREKRVKEEFAALQEKLDTEKMLDAESLQLLVTDYALLSGLEYDISIPSKTISKTSSKNSKTSKSSKSSKSSSKSTASSSDSKALDNARNYSIVFKAKKADIANLVEFEKLLFEEAPYLRISSVSMYPSKRMIEATYKISSFIVKLPENP